MERFSKERGTETKKALANQHALVGKGSGKETRNSVFRNSVVCRLVRAGRYEPMLLQPSDFRSQGCTAVGKGPQGRTVDRGEVGRPVAVRRGFDMRRPTDRDLAERLKVDRLAVDHADTAVRFDHQFHPTHRGRRCMLRRGRSTNQPSSAASTRVSSCVKFCRNEGCSRSCCGALPPMTCRASATKRSSCSSERMFNRWNRSKNSSKFVTAESRNTFGWPSSPCSRSAKWLTNCDSSSANVCSANFTASSNRVCTRAHSL